MLLQYYFITLRMRFQKLNDHFHAEIPEQFENLDSILSPYHQYIKISNSLQTLHNFPSSPVYVFERIRNIFGTKQYSYQEFQYFNQTSFSSEIRSPASGNENKRRK